MDYPETTGTNCDEEFPFSNRNKRTVESARLALAEELAAKEAEIERLQTALKQIREHQCMSACPECKATAEVPRVNSKEKPNS